MYSPAIVPYPILLMQANHTIYSNGISLSPKGTLYRPILNTGPRLPIKDVNRTPSTDFALDTTTQLSPSGVFRTQRTDYVDPIATTALGVLGPASAFAPVLAAPVAAAGLGYGVYKAGQALKIW